MNRWIAIAWMACAWAANAGEKLAGGPYVINVGQRTATVGWVVETGEVSLGTAPDSAEKRALLLRNERVLFTGLQPGKTYYYTVPGFEGVKGSFKTSPAQSTPFQFVVYGDTRTRHEVHRKVIDAVLKYSSPDFVVHTGDLVADGADSSLWPVFFDIERDLLKKAAFFPALGNHERNDRQYYDFFAASAYYSFNWGNAHFSVLDSDIANAASTPAARDAFWSEQVRWLEDDLKSNQRADFRQGDNPHMTALMPLLEKYKVTAGFFGHDHKYQHYLKNGIHYFITGGGGAPLYDVDKPPPGITLKVASTENFVIVKVNGKRARVEAMGRNGEAIESAGLK